MADPANSIAVASGGLVVTGNLTAFIAAEQDLFVASGAVGLIATRDSNTRLTLAAPWAGPTLQGFAAWSILPLGPYWRSTVTTNRRLSDLLGKWETVSPFRFDEFGTLAGRASYNAQARGFVYVATDQTPIQIFVKLNNTNAAGDWSRPIYLGSGGQVEYAAALAQEVTARTDGDATLKGRLDTLDNANLPTRVTTLEGNITDLRAAAFANRAAATSYRPTAAVGLIRLSGYTSAGDGGGGDYRRLRSGETTPALLNFATADGQTWVPVGEPVTVRQAGARGDGAVDDLVAFRDFPRAYRAQVPRGTYRLSSDIVDFTRSFDFEQGVTITGPGRLYADVRRPFLARVQRPSLAAVVQKMKDGQTVSIDAFGDSLMWGLLGDGQGDAATQGNGYDPSVSGGSRSSITVPQALQAALRSIYKLTSNGGVGITVTNRGYPGDTAYTMLRRWYDQPASDVAIVMIGTNDGVNNGDVAQHRINLRAFIERRLELGCAVVMMLPPETSNLDYNARIQLFRSSARDLANEYALPVVDARDQLQPLGYRQWVNPTDVHLSTPGYQLLGWDMAALFAPTAQTAPMRFGPSTRITPADAPTMGWGGFVINNVYPISRDGLVLQVDPDYTITIPVYVEDECAPVLETIVPDMAKRRDLIYSRLGADVLTASFATLPADGVYRRSFALPVLSRGWRVLQFRGSQNSAFFDTLTGMDPRTETFSAAGLYRASPLAGQFRPRIFSGTGGWYAREFKRVSWVHHLAARLTLDPVARCGIAIMDGDDQELATGAARQLAVLRSGRTMILRATGKADVTIADVFPADVVWSGPIEFEINTPNIADAYLNVLIGGFGVGNRTGLPFVGGYPALVATGPGILECAALSIKEG